MKGSQGITTDVNIYFINYQMKKTPMVKTNWWYSFNQKRLIIKWMHIIYPIYHFLEAALFWDISASFWFFLLIINRESQLHLYQQMRRDYKIKFTNKLITNLWIHFDLVNVHCLKGLTSPSIVSYVNFVNLNNILTLPKLLLSLKLEFETTYVCLVFCLPDLHACVLVYKIKTNASRLFSFWINFSFSLSSWQR